VAGKRGASRLVGNAFIDHQPGVTAQVLANDRPQIVNANAVKMEVSGRAVQGISLRRFVMLWPSGGYPVQARPAPMSPYLAKVSSFILFGAIIFESVFSHRGLLLGAAGFAASICRWNRVGAFPFSLI